MEKRYYFGKLDEYGPYRKQLDGWPHEGDVIRDFREKQGISPEITVHRYGEASGMPAVTGLMHVAAGRIRSHHAVRGATPASFRALLPAGQQCHWTW